ncbi:MAG: LamG domain-containing protein [Spirochaetes bacterium]|nr:LamG domain-containing protein [Spirochaetota bacterium]
MKRTLVYPLLLSLLGFSPLTAASLTDGLVGHWQFTGSDGKTVRDLSPKGNSGIITAGEIQQENAASSLEFNGMDTMVTIEERTPFALADNVTTAVWVKPFEMKKFSLIFGRPHTNGGWSTPMFGMYFDSKKAYFGTWNGKGEKVLLNSGDELEIKTWVHLAAAYDGSKAVFYVNGEKKSEMPHSGAIGSNGMPFYIGQPPWRTSQPIRARVGELRLYNRALSAAEIRSLFQATKNGYDITKPVQKKNFNDGTVIVESPGNTTNGIWQRRETRTLELLEGYAAKADTVHVNKYGGWTDRPKEAATGFFYTKNIGGRWWMFDPDGYRFIHIGMNQTGPVKSAEAALKTKFGTKEKWAEETSRIFFENGFNGKGSGSMNEIPLSRAVSRPLAYTWLMGFMSSFGYKKKLTYPTAGHTGFSNDCIPVFHPDFEAHCNEYAKSVTNFVNDPYLLGIFSDNELQCSIDLLDRHLSLDVNNPNLKHGYDAAVAWLKDRLGHTDLSRCTRRDRMEFITFVFERYYRIVSAALRKYDTNHLYIGSRICYSTQFDNPFFMKMTAKYVDVISINYYGVWGPDLDQVARWHEWSGKPVIITEWYAKAEDTGLANTHGAGWLVHTQKDRAAYYQHYVMGLLESKTCVGWHWFKYQDDPLESTALDAAGGANKGMFDGKYEPYQPLLDWARAVNREAYPLTEFFDAR